MYLQVYLDREIIKALFVHQTVVFVGLYVVFCCEAQHILIVRVKSNRVHILLIIPLA